MMQLPHSSSRSGVTISEVLISVVIVALLISLLFPIMGEIRKRAQGAKCIANIRTYGVALLTYAADNNGLKLWDTTDTETKRATAPQFNKWLVDGKYLSSTQPLRCPLADGPGFNNVADRYRFPYASNKAICATYPRLQGFPAPLHRVALVAEVGDWDGYESATSLNSSIWRGSDTPGTEGAIRDGRMPIARYHGTPTERGLHFFFADGSVQRLVPEDNDWTKAPVRAPTSGLAPTGFFYHSTHFYNLQNGSLIAQ